MNSTIPMPKSGVLVEHGKYYVNGRGDVVKIVEAVNDQDDLFHHGYRFRDNHGRPYRLNGGYNSRGRKTRHDLVQEY